jgi:hypothetical protein
MGPSHGVVAAFKIVDAPPGSIDSSIVHAGLAAICFYCNPLVIQITTQGIAIRDQREGALGQTAKRHCWAKEVGVERA